MVQMCAKNGRGSCSLIKDEDTNLKGTVCDQSPTACIGTEPEELRSVIRQQNDLDRRTLQERARQAHRDYQQRRIQRLQGLF